MGRYQECHGWDEERCVILSLQCRHIQCRHKLFFLVTVLLTSDALQDVRIISLSLAQCAFEGSMYLFVFFWTPSLQAAHTTEPQTVSVLPYGLIFSAFMASMMLGSLIFNQLTISKVATQAQLLTYAFILASLSFLISILYAEHEGIVFWAWCVLEMCVGIYHPAMGYLKSVIVDDGKRAAVYALMRIPLGLFVVGGLGITVNKSDAGKIFFFQRGGRGIESKV